jgi:hypothetical protein
VAPARINSPNFVLRNFWHPSEEVNKSSAFIAIMRSPNARFLYRVIFLSHNVLATQNVFPAYGSIQIMLVHRI